MTSRPILTIITILALIPYAATAIMKDKAIPPGLISAISPAVSILSFVAILYDGWLWAWWPFSLLSNKRPDLRGTWRIKITSAWIDPNTGKSMQPFLAYFSISETNSNLIVRQYSEQSYSEALASVIITAPDHTHSVAAVYDNDPKLMYQKNGSTRHRGGFILRYSNEAKPRLKGHYWTDRQPQTSGEMDAERISEKHSGSFEQAQSLDTTKTG